MQTYLCEPHRNFWDASAMTLLCFFCRPEWHSHCHQCHQSLSPSRDFLGSLSSPLQCGNAAGRDESALACSCANPWDGKMALWKHIKISSLVSLQRPKSVWLQVIKTLLPGSSPNYHWVLKLGLNSLVFI